MTDRSRILFINVGHGLDHLFLLLYPTVVLTLEGVFGRSYGELLSLAVPGFIAFAAGTLPAGWLGDRWSRPAMLAVFFVGIGVSSILTGLARSPFELAVGLTLIGLFASIYHPVGIAMLVEGREKVGKLLGVNGVAGNLGLAAAAIVAAALSEAISWRAAFIVPGVLTLLIGILFVAVCRQWRNTAAAPARPPLSWSGGRPSRTLLRLVLVIGVATALTGLTFQTTTIALPKLFDEGLTGIADGALGIGALVSVVIAVAAFAQIGVGWLIDRYPAKPVWIAVLFAQAPLIAAAGFLADHHHHHRERHDDQPVARKHAGSRDQRRLGEEHCDPDRLRRVAVDQPADSDLGEGGDGNNHGNQCADPEGAVGDPGEPFVE